MKGIAAVTNGSVGDVSQDYNKPHTVNLSAYRIGETEVTQELWQAVMYNNPSNFKDSLKNPVEQVDWYKCIAFCNELTKKVNGGSESECVYTVDGHVYTEGDAQVKKDPAMDMNKKGFRLPTEAEWEWAAKGGTENKWAGTDDQSQLENYAWYRTNSHSKTHEVKKKLPNGYGLYDMSGNVWEWCWDKHGDSTPAGGQTDPTGAASDSHRVRRGGSWLNDAEKCVVGIRNYFMPNLCFFSIGFRVACRP